MATSTQIFKALIQADADGAVKDLRKFNGEVEKATVGGAKKTDQLGAAFSKVGRVVAGLGIADAMRRSIDAASDLEESANAVAVTFGTAAGGIEKLSEDAARGVGLAASEFNGLAVQFSSFAERVAGDGGDVVGVIDEITTRAADFASVMNLEVSEAARIFQSALSGETEPIKKFGIDMSAAAVEAYALANGLAESKGEMTEAIKVQARYGLLMEATNKTAGDFANTSDSLANRQRILKAELTNAAAALGQELLPAASTAAGTLGDIVGVLGEMPSAARQFTVGAGAVALGLATIGTKATATLGLLGLVAGEVKAISAGIQGDMDFLSRDVSIFEKPFQLAGQFGFALGSGGGWGSWRDEALDALEAAEMAAMQFDGTLLATAATTDEARAITLEWAAGLGLSEDATLHAANAVTAKFAPGVSAAADAMGEATEATESQISATQIINGEIELAAANFRRFGSDGVENMDGVSEAAARAEERHIAAAEATERHTAAIAALFDEVNDNLSTMFDYDDAVIDLQNSSEDLATNTWELAEAQSKGELTAAEYERGLRDLRQEENSVAQSALATATAYAESQGAIQGTTQFAMLQRQELARLAGQFPGLNDEIAMFVAELDRIPAVKTVSLILERGSVNAALQRSTGGRVRVDEFGNLRNVAGATGGIVTRPTYSLIGEAGPEAVIPLNRTPGSSPLPGGLGGGATNITVNVVAPAGANTDEFGRKVGEAVRREMRWNGPVSGWAA